MGHRRWAVGLVMIVTATAWGFDAVSAGDTPLPPDADATAAGGFDCGETQTIQPREEAQISTGFAGAFSEMFDPNDHTAPALDGVDGFRRVEPAPGGQVEIIVDTQAVGTVFVEEDGTGIRAVSATVCSSWMRGAVEDAKGSMPELLEAETIEWSSVACPDMLNALTTFGPEIDEEDLTIEQFIEVRTRPLLQLHDTLASLGEPDEAAVRDLYDRLFQDLEMVELDTPEIFAAAADLPGPDPELEESDPARDHVYAWVRARTGPVWGSIQGLAWRLTPDDQSWLVRGPPPDSIPDFEQAPECGEVIELIRDATTIEETEGM